MAPTGPNASRPSTLLSMKLLVNTKAGRVIFAEAGKEVVDFLFSLLTLPVGAVVKLLSKDAMVGCIGNLCGSVENLDAAYLHSADAKNALLSPAGGGFRSGRLLRLAAAAASPAATVVYQCSEGGDEDSCYSSVSVVRNAPCRHCGGEMNVPIQVVDSSRGEAELASLSAPPAAAAGMGFVREVVTYTITDDLKVAPTSTVSGLAALKTFGVTDISSLQEMTVRVGYNECLKMLQASLQSNTVLTEVFLQKKKAPSNKKRKWKPKNKSTTCPSKKKKGKA